MNTTIVSRNKSSLVLSLVGVGFLTMGPISSFAQCLKKDRYTCTGTWCAANSGMSYTVCEPGWVGAAAGEPGQLPGNSVDIKTQCFVLNSPTSVLKLPCETTEIPTGFNLADGCKSAGGGCCFFRKDNGRDSGLAHKPMGAACTGPAGSSGGNSSSSGSSGGQRIGSPNNGNNGQPVHMNEPEVVPE